MLSRKLYNFAARILHAGYHDVEAVLQDKTSFSEITYAMNRFSWTAVSRHWMSHVTTQPTSQRIRATSPRRKSNCIRKSRMLFKLVSMRQFTQLKCVSSIHSKCVIFYILWSQMRNFLIRSRSSIGCERESVVIRGFCCDYGTEGNWRSDTEI